MAEVLEVEPGSLLQQQNPSRASVFHQSLAARARMTGNCTGAVTGFVLIPPGVTNKVVAYLIEIKPRALVEGHFLGVKSP